MSASGQPSAARVRILGVDPGSVVTGYGLIESDGVDSRHLEHGQIRLGDRPLAERLGEIFRRLDELVRQWQPQEAAVEQVFVARNAMAALKLGQARGAALSAVVQHGLRVAEYSPRAIKQATAGTGGASKEQVQHMIKILLRLPATPPADAADALAAALCHAHHRRVGLALEAGGAGAARRRRR